MCDLLATRNLYYNLMSQTDFIRTRVNASSFGLNYLKYLATKIWDIVPNDIKSVGKLNSLKKKRNNWTHFRLSKHYVRGVEYEDIF